MRVKTKALVIVALVLASLLLIMVAGLTTAKAAANADNRARIEQLMRSTYLGIVQLEQMAADGKLTEEQAKAIATQITRENKYHESEYCYVTDENLVFIATPMDPQLHGTSFNEFKDSQGKSVGGFAKAALQASGGKLTEYWWTSTRENKSVQILSVAIETPRWKWIVGNGVSFAEADKRFWASAQWQVLVCLAAAAVVAGILLYGVSTLLRSLGDEPDVVTQRLQRVAAGDLRVDKENTLGKAAPESILYAVEKMRQSLHGVLSTVIAATQSMQTACQEIAAGNRDLSTRTELAASSLEETSSSMAELSEAVRGNVNNTQMARDLAARASDVAQQGGGVMGEVVNTMQDINTSSNKINDIIGVIDGIAFQTNILALNAAVEAARAGEQGRGFAVVAAEVRSLAQRSAAAAREIKVLISDSSSRVETGTRLVGNAGSTMQEIVQAGQQVNQVITEISASTQGQGQSISEISESITQLDQMTQQNAALVEQATAATDSLSTQAQQLATLVDDFKL